MLKKGDRVLHNAQAREGKYWANTPTLYGTVVSYNDFTGCYDVTWDDGNKRPPLPESALAKIVPYNISRLT